MRAQFLLLGMLGASCLLLAPSVRACPACGDKLGVPFARIHSGHLADRIIFFARPDSELRTFSKRAGLIRRMERSGHTVRVVDNDADLEAELRANRSDLLLADPADASALRARLTGDISAPVVISLAVVATAVAEDDLKMSSCRLQATVAQTETVVQTIGRFVSSRQDGKVFDCDAGD